MGRRVARAARSAVQQADDAAALDVKIEVLRVQMIGVEKTVNDSVVETRRWRDEIRLEAGGAALTAGQRMDKHEAQDDARHGAIEKAIEHLDIRLGASELRALPRIEALERGAVASAAVDLYRRWLIGLVIMLAGSLGFNALRAFKVL